MIPVADAPLLALPSGSILQFLLMTLPLLAVYVYFLVLAVDRKNIANPNDPRYAEDRIRLTDILHTYLVTLVLFCSLVVYLLWFVTKRRKLSKRYENEAIVILGNVEYEESHWSSDGNCCANVGLWMANGFTLRNNYGRVVYDLERVANHPACDAEDPKGRRGGKRLSGTITKKVRVYYRYPREQVSILVLPEHPYSGQPKIDMEADWASFSTHVGLPSEHLGDSERSLSTVDVGNRAGCAPANLRRDRSRGIILVSAAWILFLFFSSLYVAVQIGVVEEYYEDEDARTSWIVFWCMVGGGIPLVAFGGNFVRWMVYEQWMLKRGTKKRAPKKKKKKKKSKENQSADGAEVEEGSGYVQMT